jgi:hypothetical protein
VSVANMDKSARPGDDFYTYANGAWVKRTEIPADRASVGSFLVAFNTTEGQLNTLIAGILASNPAPGTDAQKIRDYYRAYLDTAAIDAKGMAPLKGDLARYAAIQSKTDLARVLGENLRADTDPLNATNYHTENLFGLFHHPGAQGRRGGALSDAGRPGHARAGLLPVHRRQDGDDSGPVSRLYRHDPDRCGPCRRRCAGAGGQDL